MTAFDVTNIEHRDGIVWVDAPKPFRIHRHRWQTRAISDGELIERCACGAFGDGKGHWLYVGNDKPRVWP